MSVVSQARLYKDAALQQPPDFSDYNNLQLTWGKQEDYEVMDKVGRGKYSQVFSGINVNTMERVAIKVLNPIRRRKVKREIKIMQNLSGDPHIPQLIDIVKDSPSRSPCLIYQFTDNEDYKTLYPRLNDFEIRFYMYELLKTLDFAHQSGVMHRDIKPNNIMIDHPNR